MAMPAHHDTDHHDTDHHVPRDAGAPVFPGFREMGEARRRLLADLVACRRTLGLSQTEVAARMRTSQSAVARLEAQGADARLSTLERYAAAVGRQIEWRLAAGAAAPPGRPEGER